MWLFVKFFLSATYRSEVITSIRYPGEMIQRSTTTRMNRYPRLYEIAAQELKDIPDPAILSFGCSTGEEVISIRTHIPNARITGVDINHRVIRIARKKISEDKIGFYHYRDLKWKTSGPYDCIFALAIFQKTEHREQDQKHALKSFSFSKFEQMTEDLDGLLKAGGILVIDNADYSFQDLAISKHYTIAKQDQAISRNRPTITQQNKKEASTPGYRVFIKNHQASS